MSRLPLLCAALLTTLSCGDKADDGASGTDGTADTTDGASDGADGAADGADGAADGADGAADGADGSADGADGGDGGATEVKCDDVSTTAVDSMDVSAGGFDFSIRAVMVSVGGTWTGTLSGEDGGSQPVTMTFTNDAWNLELVERTPADEGGPEDCPPAYRFNTPFSLATDDGAIVESGTVQVVATFINEASFEYENRANTLGGSRRPEVFTESEWPDVLLRVTLRHPGGSTWTGGAAFVPAEASEDTAEPPSFEALGQFEFPDQTPFD
jgi:hypothetical protein